MLAASLKLIGMLVAAAAPGGDRWTIHSDRGHDRVARQVAALLPRAQRELEQRLGLELHGHGSVVLCGSTASFRRETPGVDHRHTLGVAYPARSTILLNCEAIEAAPYESFAVTLRHELCHVLVGEIVRGGHRRVPLWFDEGVAVYTSGKVPLYNPQAFELAVRARALSPLAELRERFPGDPTRRGVAYEQSESFVRFVVRRHGEQALRSILRAAARGVDFEPAFQQATGGSVVDLEAQWLASLTPRWPWLGWAANVLFHPYSAFGVFGIMTLLALASFWVYWRRRRRKYEQWEREEGSHAGKECPWA